MQRKSSSDGQYSQGYNTETLIRANKYTHKYQTTENKCMTTRMQSTLGHETVRSQLKPLPNYAFSDWMSSSTAACGNKISKPKCTILYNNNSTSPQRKKFTSVQNFSKQMYGKNIINLKHATCKQGNLQ